MCTCPLSSSPKGIVVLAWSRVASSWIFFPLDGNLQVRALCCSSLLCHVKKRGCCVLSSLRRHSSSTLTPTYYLHQERSVVPSSVSPEGVLRPCWPNWIDATVLRRPLQDKAMYTNSKHYPMCAGHQRRRGSDHAET